MNFLMRDLKLLNLVIDFNEGLMKYDSIFEEYPLIYTSTGYDDRNI